MMDSSRKTDNMEKPSITSIQQQQAAAVQKCPRCDSTNTKFCYYNNYSLTQPRHFCKACKRYWTRGGTLRNVPVGGGCRRNKRLKRPSNSSFSSLNNHHNGTSSLVVLPSSTNTTTTATNNNHTINPLFYGLPSNPSDLNHHLQFSGYDNLDLDHGHGQQQHHLGGTNLGLGFFSSGLVLNEDYRNGFASDSILSSYGGGSSSSSMFGSSSLSTNSSATPTMASIIANNYHLKNLSPFENMEINGDHQSGGTSGVKVEQNRFANWSVPSSQIHQIQQFGASNDNNPCMYWSNTNWPTADLTNIGSSVTSLI